MNIDVEQARKRAKELVRSGRAPQLADAQRQIARELGYRSWPAMVHAVEAPTPERFVVEAGHRPDRALEFLEAAPWMRDDPWVALTLGDASRIDNATAPGGPLNLPPLFYVARSRVMGDSAAAAGDLIDRGADPNGEAGEEWTNLSIACARGDAPLVRLLLEAGAEPDDNDSLYHSVEPRASDCTRLLLEHGATVTGTNALWHALDYDRLERVRLLLDHGADPDESRRWPALHHAVARGRGPEFARLLVERGAAPGARDASGRTAIQLAFRRGQAEMVDVLRKLGAPAEFGDDDVALNALATGRKAATLELDDDARDVLIEIAMHDIDGLGRVIDAAGPRFSASWGGGPRGTLLHQSAWLGRADYVDLLLSRGASPHDRVDTEHATPLGWAAVGSRYSPAHPHDSFRSPDADWVAVAKLLVAAGARVEPKDIEMAVPPLSTWLATA